MVGKETFNEAESQLRHREGGKSGRWDAGTSCHTTRINEGLHQLRAKASWYREKCGD